jgi:hypothetical protein
MRRWLIILLALPLFTTLPAQNRKLSQYEYWIDKDYSSRTTRTLSASEERIGVQIDTREMQEGIHTVSLRIADETGAWSGTLHSSYLVFRPEVHEGTQLTTCEYWIDADFEQRQQTSVQNGLVAMQVDASNLTPGTHYLNSRMLDSNGVASAILRSFFFVCPAPEITGGEIAAYEYWIDGDFEHRQEAAASGENIVFSINSTGLTEGRHSVSLRVRNSLGIYGSILHDSFYKYEVEERGGTPVLCEYWFDEDFAARQEVPVVDGNVAFYAETSGQTEGMHSLSWRIKDDKGIYSATNSSRYYKRELQTLAEDIVWYQYWWNDRSDLAVRKEVTHSGELAMEDIFEVPDYVAESTGMEPGTAEFHILFCNDKGNLSNIVTEVVEDRIPPVSHMNPLPLSQETNEQVLSWSGSDKWAGVKDYSVYVYDNSKKEWVAFLEHTTETSAPFYCSLNDEIVKFFVIARDSLDNEEPMKTEAEAQIRFMYTDIYPPTTTLSVSSEMVNAGESVVLTWESIDDVNEIAVNNVYFTEDGGPLILWKSVSGTNSATFKGKAGSTYMFIVTGNDSVGNKEKPDMEKAVTVRFNR